MNEVYLLVGGEATRLQPLSFGIPKALLKIKNKPIIEYIFEEYLKIGDFNFNLISSSKHKEIWQQYKIDSKFKFNILVEEMKLDTAGYIVQNLDTFPEKFFCMNGDLLLDINLDKFVIESNNNSISTIGSIEVSDPTRYGVLLLNQNNIISEFIEKPSDDRFGNKISVGLYHLYKSDIETIKDSLDIPCSFEKQLFPNLAKKSLLKTFTVNGSMKDVGTKDSFIEAHLSSNDKFWIGNDVSMSDKNVKIINSVILDNSIIEGDVIIENSIISEHSIIKSGSTIKDMIFRELV